ncbi:MAG: phosphoribosylglycinamide synthetase C domain-containing protein, partial [Bacillota bacterium]
QDHKRAFDGDKGLNTGGMGAFCPSPFYTEDIQKEAYDSIILPTVRAMSDMGRTFKGVLYFGLMMTDKGVYTLEYNARFGDPETQAVLPLLKTDIVDIFEATIDGNLADIDIEWSTDSAITIVLASGGYPEKYKTGLPITIGETEGVTVYHAGTADKGGLVTNGGRVMAVTAVAKDIASAREIAYKQIDNIAFEGMFYRKDIGII